MDEQFEAADDVVKNEENAEDAAPVIHSIDKETILEAERVVKEQLPEVEKTLQNMRKTFWQSNVIRMGIVLVALKVVTITGEIVAERMRENKKPEEK